MFPSERWTSKRYNRNDKVRTRDGCKPARYRHKDNFAQMRIISKKYDRKGELGTQDKCKPARCRYNYNEPLRSTATMATTNQKWVQADAILPKRRCRPLIKEPHEGTTSRWKDVQSTTGRPDIDLKRHYNVGNGTWDGSNSTQRRSKNDDDLRRWAFKRYYNVRKILTSGCRRMIDESHVNMVAVAI